MNSGDAAEVTVDPQQSSTVVLINRLAARTKKIGALSYWLGIAGCACLAIGWIVFWPTSSSAGMLGHEKIAVPKDFALWALNHPETAGFIIPLESSGFNQGPKGEVWFGIATLIIGMGIIWLASHICRKHRWDSIWRLPIAVALGAAIFICVTPVVQSAKWSLREYYPENSSFQINKHWLMSENQLRIEEDRDKEKSERSLEAISFKNQIAAVLLTADRKTGNTVEVKRLLDIALRSGSDTLSNEEKGVLYRSLRNTKIEQRIDALDQRIEHLPLFNDDGPIKKGGKIIFAKTSNNMGQNYTLVISPRHFPHAYADQANYLLAQESYHSLTRSQVAYYLSQLTGTWSPKDEFTKTRIGILYEFASFRGKGAYPSAIYRLPDLSIAKAIADGRPYQNLRYTTANWLYSFGVFLTFIAACFSLLAAKRWSLIRRLEARYRFIISQINRERAYAF